MLKKNTAFIRVLELKVLKTFILDTFATAHRIKQLFFFAFWIFGGWGPLEVSNSIAKPRKN